MSMQLTGAHRRRGRPQECTNVFARGGGESLAAALGYRFLGRVPIDPHLTLAHEHGANFLELWPASPTRLAWDAIAAPLLALPTVRAREIA